MKRFLGIALSALLLAEGMSVPVSAAEAGNLQTGGIYLIAEESTNEEQGISPRGAYLSDGMSCITRESSKLINISGITNAKKTCDKLILTLYVERSTKYATGYSTYESFHFTAKNVYQLAKEISNIPIERGYYYRVKGVHSVTNNGKTETTDSVTDPIDFR